MATLQDILSGNFPAAHRYAEGYAQMPSYLQDPYLGLSTSNIGNVTAGLLGTTAKNKNVYSLLEQQNKTTTPKIPTGNIFQNEAIQLPSSKRKTIDEIIGKGKESSLPSEYVDVSQIVPTQKNVTIPNLKSVKNVPTDEAIAVKDNGMYYLIDGHHRVANQILNNNNNVKIRVLE
jgi:hypothetical protein